MNKIKTGWFFSHAWFFKGALSCLRQLLATESPLKMIKMLFISPRKLFSFSRYLSFCLEILVMYRNGLIKKIRLIWYFTMLIHKLPNISRGEGNQTMKFGQLIECNMRNIFLEKSYTKCGGETSPRPFSEKLKLTISLDQYWN